MKPLVIAIDGPAASGKGTLAELIAKRHDLAYLDTGTLYRAVAKAVLDGRADPRDEAAAAAAVARIDVARLGDESLQTWRTSDAPPLWSRPIPLCGRPSWRSSATSPPSAGRPRSAVLDGRIGSVVCPDTAVKLFIIASPEVRAHRRWLELKAKGNTISEAGVLADLKKPRRARCRAQGMPP
ncbi:MAG: (d)CMP kinase [Alphaproteobacteria bacterium]